MSNYLQTNRMKRTEVEIQEEQHLSAEKKIKSRFTSGQLIKLQIKIRLKGITVPDTFVEGNYSSN
jgi:hypothetical protein